MNDQPTRRFAAFDRRNFRLYFVGQTISNVGSWLQNLAVTWLVLEITNRPDQLGVYFGASPGPASVTLEYVDAATNGVSLSWRNYSSAPWQEYPGAMQVVQLPAPWPPPPLRPPPTGPPNMP